MRLLGLCGLFVWVTYLWHCNVYILQVLYVFYFYRLRQDYGQEVEVTRTQTVLQTKHEPS